MKPSKTALRTGGIAALTATLSLGALPALAGGVAEPAPMPAVIPAAPAPVAGADWTGFYAGAQIEYGDVDVSGAGQRRHRRPRPVSSRATATTSAPT
jgi:hypothetical protein